MISLYVDDDPDGPWISLGGAYEVAKAAREIGEVSNPDDNTQYGELFGFYETAMDQNATSKEWRRKVSRQAADFLKQHGDKLSTGATHLLTTLRDQPLSGGIKRRHKPSGKRA